MKKIPLIIDCDPGVDDAIALLLLSLNKNKYDIKLLSSCSGNLSIDTTTKNLKFFVKNFFDNSPISQGYGKPLKRKVKATADEVHGESGLGNLKITDLKYNICTEQSHHKMYQILNKTTEKITFMCLGPLTNIALLILTYPQIKNKIDKIYCMIGSINGIGNVKPYAEFNAFYDPEALKVVSESDIPIVYNTIEVGLKCRLKKARVENELNSTSNQKLVKTMISGVTEPDDESTACLFDPCAFLSLNNPELFEFINCNAEVFTDNETPGKCILSPNLASKSCYIMPKDANEIENYVMTQLKKL